MRFEGWLAGRDHYVKLLLLHASKLSGSRTCTYTPWPAGIEAVNKEVKEVRNSAQHEMVLAEDSEADKVIAYLQGLKEQVDRLQAEAARINKYQALFKVGRVEMCCGWLGWGSWWQAAAFCCSSCLPLPLTCYGPAALLYSCMRPLSPLCLTPSVMGPMPHPKSPAAG